MYLTSKHFINLWGIILIFLILGSGCEKNISDNGGSSPSAPSSEQASSKTKSNPETMTDKSLPDFQDTLLDIAIESAGAIAKEPFIKDRCRAQEAVVNTCLELDQPKLALTYTAGIENWRRGLCHANVAFYCARHGYDPKLIQKELEIAEKIAQMDHGQQWRNDRIKVRIAQTHLLLGQPEQARRFNQSLVESEQGKIAQTAATISNDETFDNQVKTLNDLIGLCGFETTINALEGYAELYNRFYDDDLRRNLAETKIKTSWNKLPIPIRLTLLLRLAEFSLDHEDQDHALELVNEAQQFLDDFQWPLRNFLPEAAKAAQVRYRAGDKQNARKNADAVWNRYQAEGSQIINIYRAGALRPLAEAYQAMGATDMALNVYKKAVEEGVDHPSKRSRALDLSATCCSMASSAVEPDAELWTRIQQIHEDLITE